MNSIASKTLPLICLALASCGGSSGDDDKPGPQPPTAEQACAALQGFEIAADKIGLPTTGAKIVSAEMKPAEGRQPEYCSVVGSVAPVDAQAPAFAFSLGLPTDWNKKMLQQGGGGYDGKLIAADKQPTMTDPSTPSPLARGYVTAASDGGHQQPDGAFAMNTEAFANYAGDELKKVHDIAHVIIQQRYGQAPERTYFSGFSEGGREALYLAQRYPKLYDGIIAGSPVYSVTIEESANILMMQHHYAPGGLMNGAKMDMLQQAVIQQCDGLDGVEDGIISAPDACHFDPATLLCPDGQDTGDTCLSTGQVATVKAVGSPVKLDFQLANGVDTYQAYPILKGGNISFGTASSPSVPPAAGQDPAIWAYGDAAVRWFIMQDAHADLLTFDPNNYRARMQEVSELLDATSSDISAFQAAGGKLLLTQGATDAVVSPENTSRYYESLVDRFGRADLDTFVRYYFIPGFNHGSGTPFNAKWDDLTALEQWVEQGIAPQAPVMKDMDGLTVKRTRPMCTYPQYPRYEGGDQNSAESFVCADYEG